MDEVYQKYAKTVYRYLLSLTADSDLAEELLQETFYQAVRTIDRYDESCRMSTWLCGIAKNVLRTYYRKQNRWRAKEVSEVENAPSAEQDAMWEVSRTELFRLVHTLPEPYREIIYLRVVGELSFKEIGEILGKSENYARVTYYRGKEKLRGMYRNEE